MPFYSKSLVSGKILFCPDGTTYGQLNYLTTNIISLRDCPLRDKIFVERESNPNLESH